MRIVIFLLTIFLGKKAGEDSFGNQYYYSKFKLFNRERRWVCYKGIIEASKVPDNWECWLRHITETPLAASENSVKHHTPNLTGTCNAFTPNLYNEKVNFSHLYKPWNRK